MRIIIAPDSFKGTLSAADAADAIAAGVRAARRDADVVCVPMADGGEGTLHILVRAKCGRFRQCEATGPLGERRTAELGLIDGASTAVIELAQIAGLTLVPPDRRDSLRTTTFGVGELMRAALDSGVEGLLLTVGGSATVDGGAGMIQALGLTLYDQAGRLITPPVGGGDLQHIAQLGDDHLHPALRETRITIAADVLNRLCGPNGAARIFGPQKGAAPEAVHTLEAGLSHWADILEQATGRDVRNEPGTGAGGGVAAPLLALFDAEITPGVDLVIDAVGLRQHLMNADLVITGEGRLDATSLMGKVVGGVARLARATGVPCVAIAGSLGPGWERCEQWLDDIVAASDLSGSQEASLHDPAPWLTRAAEELMRRISVQGS